MAVTTTPGTPQAPEAKGSRSAVDEGRIGGGLLDPRMLWRSTPDAIKKLDPRVQIRNPVMFVVEVGAVLCLYTAIFKDRQPAFNWTIVVWLFLTVVFANLAEAVAEGRGKAQAETLRRTKRETVARRLIDWRPGQQNVREEPVPGTCSSRSPVRRRATVSVLALRRVSACALPRPSATASARLANTTVSQSQATIVQLKTVEFVIAV